MADEKTTLQSMNAQKFNFKTFLKGSNSKEKYKVQLLANI